jgi:hypothetical protein
MEQSLSEDELKGRRPRVGASFRAARFLFMPRPWLWGVTLGLCVGGGVVLLSSLRHGLSAPLLLLGIVLAVGFGGLGVVGVFVRGRPHVD